MWSEMAGVTRVPISDASHTRYAFELCMRARSTGTDVRQKHKTLVFCTESRPGRGIRAGVHPRMTLAGLIFVKPKARGVLRFRVLAPCQKTGMQRAAGLGEPHDYRAIDRHDVVARRSASAGRSI